jgi:hypothetical protein
MPTMPPEGSTQNDRRRFAKRRSALVGSGRRPHYALIKEGVHDPFVVRDWNESYNVEAIEYGPTHDSLIDDLEMLFADVDELRKGT